MIDNATKYPGASGTARKAPGPSSSGDGSRGSASAPLQQASGSGALHKDPDADPLPPGLISIDPKFGGRIVLLQVTASRIALHPDAAEQLGLELIRRAEAARIYRGEQHVDI